MTATVRNYRNVPATVDAAEYDGRNAVHILHWVRSLGGTAFPAADLGWRHDVGTYWHTEHGFIYLPGGARTPGSRNEALRDDEIIVRTGAGVYAVVFPGDYVVRSRSGFYPLRAESFHRSYVVNTNRRGAPDPPLPPPP